MIIKFTSGKWESYNPPPTRQFPKTAYLFLRADDIPRQVATSVETVVHYINNLEQTDRCICLPAFKTAPRSCNITRYIMCQVRTCDSTDACFILMILVLNIFSP